MLIRQDYCLIERWYKKSVLQLIAMGRPDAAYGVSMALCKAIPQFVFREDIIRGC